MAFAQFFRFRTNLIFDILNFSSWIIKWRSLFRKRQKQFLCEYVKTQFFSQLTLSNGVSESQARTNGREQPIAMNDEENKHENPFKIHMRWWNIVKFWSVASKMLCAVF